MQVRAAILSTFVALGVVFAGMPAFSANGAATENLLRLLGYETFVEGVAEAIGEADNDIAASDRGFEIAWTLAANQVFSPSEMMEEILQDLNGALDADEIADGTAFLTSDLGVRVTAMEIEAQKPGQSDIVAAQGAEILADLIAKNDPRLDKYTQIIEAFSSIDSGVAGAMNISFAIYSGMSKSGKMPFELSEAEILSVIASQEDMVRAQVRDHIYVTSAYTYRDLSPEDLSDYIVFLTSKTGRAIYGAVNRSTEAVLARRARIFGGRLMDLQGVQEL